ncbi:MAG: hypothetical protein K6T90_14640 [Leptolyngbyaceae cyanobacterium HOT.MB2.61]|nr:hypothetical protein [Leptolyngbyaceae cyanobacterium HOT.MB2.61]
MVRTSELQQPMNSLGRNLAKPGANQPTSPHSLPMVANLTPKTYAKE